MKPAIFSFLLFLGFGCAPQENPAADDTAAKEDPQENGVCGEEDPNPFLCNAPWNFAFTLPEELDVTDWEVDTDFWLPGYSVGHLLVLHDGTYRMTLTGNEQKKYLARSTDGLEWTIDPKPFLDISSYTSEAVQMDLAELYLPDGRYRLMIIGMTGMGEESASFILSAISEDGDHWDLEEGIRYEIPKEDGGISSVWSVMWSDLYQGYLAYYVADFWRVNNIRTAFSEDGFTFVPFTGEGVTPENRGDPCVTLDGKGGVRIFTVQFILTKEDGSEQVGVEGHFTVFRSDDWITLEDETDLTGFERFIDLDTYSDIFDPEVLRLPDGRVEMFFGNDAEGTMGLRRAFLKQ